MYRVRLKRIAPLFLTAAVVGLSMTAAPSAEASPPGSNGPVLAGVIISGGQQGIATENTDGSNKILFGTQASLGQGQTPAWAPDGTRIVYESGEGGAVSSLPDNTGSYPIDEGVNWMPTFTADGASVIVTTPVCGTQTCFYQLETAPSTWNVLNHQGQGSMKPWFATSTGGTDLYPSASPSTGAVFFEHDAAGSADIWTDHGTRTPGLLIANGGQPDVSPDGARLAFVRKVSGYDQLFLQASDGSGAAVQVTTDAANHDYPKWSPDGSTLYYNYNAGTDYSQIVGHELVLATSADTPTPNGLSFVTQQPVPKPAPASTFHAVPPVRVLDTRHAIGVSTSQPVAANGTVQLTLPAGAPVPAGATAVVLNVTVTAPTAAGDLEVFPHGGTASSSNLNWTAGETIPNQVVVKLGTGGAVDLHNHSSGTVHVIADVSGYYTPDSTGATYTTDGPTRILDTRDAIGVTTKTAVAPHTTVHLAVAGRASVPQTGATAVVLNVTVTGPTASGVLTVFPDGGSVPTASNLNWTAGETIANHVVVQLGSDGMVALTNNSGGSVHIVADLFGYFSNAAGGSAFHAVAPTRLMDTRNTTAVPAAGTATLDLTGSPVPAGATAVVLNVTATAPKAAGFLVVYPHGTLQPTASNLNWTTGETIPNLVTVPVVDGKILFSNHSGGTVQLIADVFGYFAK